MPPELLRKLYATHEAGHYVAWHLAGLPITKAVLVGSRRDPRGGYVDVDVPPPQVPDDLYELLVGVLAGREAGLRWTELTGMGHAEAENCEDDLTLFRHWVRHPLAKGMTEAGVRGEARRLVLANWRRVVAVAERLDRKGRI